MRNLRVLPFDDGGTRVLAFEGEIDILEKAWFEQSLGRLNQLDLESVTIIDLTHVRYADSTLLNALDRVKEHAICIVAPKDIARLFRITSLDRMFPVLGDIASARLFVHSARSNGRAVTT